jgi:hypothetical protein
MRDVGREVGKCGRCAVGMGAVTLGVLLNHLLLRQESRINPGLINPSKGVSGDAESRV